MSRRVTVPKLSTKEILILELLVEHSEMYGLELVAASRKQLKRGTVYVTLGRMEEKGYVTSHVEAAPASAGGLPRRMYVATPLGHRLLTAWSRLARQFVAEFAR